MSVDFKLWPLIPGNEMTEALEWKTDVIQAIDGSEQRISLRSYPRVSYEADFTVTSKADAARLSFALNVGQDKLWGWPCWQERLSLTGKLLSGETTIDIDTTFSTFIDGGYALLWSGWGRYEIIEIGTVSPAGLNLARATTVDFGAGCALMPIRRVRITEQATRKDYPVSIATLFSVVANSVDSVTVDAPTSAMQYLGFDVIENAGLMPGQTRDRAIDRRLFVFDSEVGNYSIEAMGEYPIITSACRWLTMNPMASMAHRRWLYRRAGRCVPVWVPSWTHDINLAEPLDATNVVIAQEIGFAAFGMAQPTRTHLAFIDKGGHIMACREIIAAASDAGRDILTLDAAIPCTGYQATVSFLTLHRLAADRIELRWKRAGVADCNASMIEVAA